MLAAACLWFFCAGRAFIPRLGVQTDEALFAGGIYHPDGAYYTARFFHHTIPLMLESYIGTLKSLLYSVVFCIFRPTASSTRLPVLLIGTVTIWLFFLLLRRISGTAAAVAGSLLLAADSTFLLTTVFDWGPVALQHLLLLTSLLLFYRYYETGRLRLAGWASFAAGLALWDKAVFIWSLSAIVVASLVVFPRIFFRLLTWRAVGVASLGFALGAAPLIRFNIAQNGKTFRSNISGSRDTLAQKLPMLVNTVRGGGLFDYLVRDDNEGAPPLPPRTALARASERLSGIFGHPRDNLMLPALAGALLLVPLLWRARTRAPRTVLFAAVFLLVAWLLMASNQGTGGSVHHVVLLWPFPHLILAVTFGEAAQKFGRAGRAALAAMLLLVVSSSLLVTNEYYRMALRNGGGLSWSDAVFPLAGFLRNTSASQVMPIDWGMFDNLCLLDAGKLPLRVGSDPLSKPALDAADREAVRQWLITPGTIFVGHTDAYEIFPGVNRRLDEIAAENGLVKEIMADFRDRNGRDIFRVFRYKDR